MNGLTCAAMMAKAGVRTLLVEQRDVTGGCAAEGEIAPGFRAPTLAHATGPVRQRRRRRAAAASAWPHVPRSTRSTSAPCRLTAARSCCGTTPARPSKACDSGRRRTRPPGRRFSNQCRRLGGLIGTLFMSAPPSVDNPGHARRVGVDANAACVSRAAEGRSVAAASLGPDGGGGSRQRIGGDGIAARDACRRRHLRRDARPVVGRQRPADAAGGGQPIAGPARRPHGRGRSGGAGPRADEGRDPLRRRDPDRCGGCPRRRDGRSRRPA